MTDELSIRVERSFKNIAPESWSRLAGASRTGTLLPYNPFVSHAFL